MLPGKRKYIWTDSLQELKELGKYEYFFESLQKQWNLWGLDRDRPSP